MAVGDKINLEEIGKVLKETKVGGESILEHAKGLSGEAVSRIEAYVPPGAPAAAEAAAQAGTEGNATPGWEGQGEGAPRAPGPGDPNYVPPESFEDSPGNVSDTLASTERHEQLLQKDWYAAVAKAFDNPKAVEEIGFSGADAAALNDARGILRMRLDEAFGRSGFLGLGGAHGADSEIWKTWKGRSLVEIFSPKVPSPEELKLRDLIQKLSEEARLPLAPNAKIEDFVKIGAFALVRRGQVTYT